MIITTPSELPLIKLHKRSEFGYGEDTKRR